LSLPKRRSRMEKTIISSQKNYPKWTFNFFFTCFTKI